MRRKSNRRQALSTRAIHLGDDPASANGALTRPVYVHPTYAFESLEQGTGAVRSEVA
ncbi:hypothetical protein ACMDCR_11895 [Labrys okinawensis]|uniref:hypothetical protein n=1 Tax=Labrys okinawensis TaxID=346911 RepID=UPI0039BCBF0C